MSTVSTPALAFALMLGAELGSGTGTSNPFSVTETRQSVLAKCLHGWTVG